MSNNTLFEDELELVHVLLAVKRRKENDGITCKQELCYRQVCYDHERDLRVLKARIADQPGVWRIYKTVNRRKVQEAKKIMLKWYIDGLHMKSRWNSVFTTALLQKECRGEKFALVDIDSTEFKDLVLVGETIDNWMHKQGKTSDESAKVIATPNGFHIVCEPFDKRILDDFDYAEVDYDRYVFVDRLTIK